jgi:hypothetical protein
MSYVLRDITPSDARTVRFGQRRRQEKVLKEYEIVVDGVVVATVCQRMETFEQRTPGRMYVNRRWETPRWFVDVPGERTRYRGGDETRKYAVERYLRDIARMPL